MALKRWLAAVAVAGLILVAGGRLANADGLHCKVLDGDDLDEAWRKLVRQTWPERRDGTAPRVSSHKERPLVETAIREMAFPPLWMRAFGRSGAPVSPPR